MSIREWSFARLWAVIAAWWFAALLVSELLDYVDAGDLVTLALALVPAFLAGAWAGGHPDIVSWPRARIAAMWGFALAVYLAAMECVGHWRMVGVALAAPVAILTLRWYELTGGTPPPPRLRQPVAGEPIVTPPPGPRKQLPTG